MEYYHVITQSYCGKNIFSTVSDCLVYLQLIKAACQKYNIRWLAYAVMPTHTHLIFAVEKGQATALTKARHKITYGYTAYARKMHPELCYKEKHIFQRKNKAKFLQTAYDVKQAIRYVHLNPIQKELEMVLGETIRSSYQAVLSLWEPENRKNPFNYFVGFQAIRDALALEEVCRLFGRNHNAQENSFLSYHASRLENASSMGVKLYTRNVEAFQKAEKILKIHFNQMHSFQGKTFNEENRQAFLCWLNRRGNRRKITIVLQLRKETCLSTVEIAEFLNTSDSTVRRIIRSNKEQS